MTVGQELQKLIGYPLELVNQFFDFGTEEFLKLDKRIRFSIFEEVANSNLPGLIFTLVWDFDHPEDESYVDEIVSIFEGKLTNLQFVELKCDLSERLIRNRTANRIKNKPSKRDLEFSEKLLLNEEEKYRSNSREGEMEHKLFFKIENTNLSALQVASQIVEHYKLP